MVSELLVHSGLSYLAPRSCSCYYSRESERNTGAFLLIVIEVQ